MEPRWDIIRLPSSQEVGPAVVCASLQLGAQRSSTGESALYRAARACTLGQTRRLVAELPQPHHPFLASAVVECPREARHQARMVALLEDMQVRTWLWQQPGVRDCFLAILLSPEPTLVSPGKSQ